MKAKDIDPRDKPSVYRAEYILLLALGAFIAWHSLGRVAQLLDLGKLTGTPGLAWEDPHLVVTVAHWLAVVLAVSGLLIAFILLLSPRAPAQSPDDADVTRPPRIAYRRRLSLYWITILLFPLFVPFLLDFIMARQDWFPDGLPDAAAAPQADRSLMDFHIIFIGFAVPFLVLGLFVAWREAPARNFLELDDETLAITRWGRRVRWSWRELGPFDLEVKNSEIHMLLQVYSLSKRCITIHMATGKPFLYPRRGGYSANFLGSALELQDIWDTPLDEIAAMLNEYRKQAVGVGDAAGGALAPAPEQA